MVQAVTAQMAGFRAGLRVSKSNRQPYQELAMRPFAHRATGLALAVTLLALNACSDEHSPTGPAGLSATLQPEAMKEKTPLVSWVVVVGNPYTVTLSWSRLLVERTWITDAAPVKPPGVELVNVYDDHTFDRAKGKGTHVATVATFPTTALFFSPDLSEAAKSASAAATRARVACSRAS